MSRDSCDIFLKLHWAPALLPSRFFVENSQVSDQFP